MAEEEKKGLSPEEITIRDICLRNGCRSAIKNNNPNSNSKYIMNRHYYCFLAQKLSDVTSDKGCTSAVVNTRRGTMKSTGFEQTTFENTPPTRIIIDPHRG
jgi:hypothetical protein